MQSILEFRLQQGVVEDVDGGAAVMVVLMEIDAGSSSLKSPSLIPSIVYGCGEIYGGAAQRYGSAMRGLVHELVVVARVAQWQGSAV